MITKKIAVCGTPYVGKTSLIGMIAKQVKGSQFLFYQHEEDPNIELSITSNQIRLQFITRRGPYFNEEQMIRKIINDSNAIIYILEPAKADGDHINFTNDLHKRYLDMHINLSKELNVHWHNIPWIIALNKTDIANGIPPEANMLTTELVNGMIQCIATQDIGVDKLWARVTDAVQL